ncbi:MAG TPA: OmpA family protein [Myxococcota bacterium]|nr:OmpA family protein [Myxococcota bacterium]
MGSVIRTIGGPGLGLMVGLALALAGSPAAASPREETIEQLDALTASASADAVRVRINEGDGAPLRIGEALRYRFESDASGYLTALHVDTHGSTTLLYPRADASEGRVGPDCALNLPSETDGFGFEVQPPIGRDVVYAIVTAEPVSRRELGIDSQDLVVSFEPHQAPDFARRLREVLVARPAGSVHVASAVQPIEGREGVLYRSADIVDFFGERTRSIRPPKLDLQVQFATDSAALDDAARRNIDEFARALEDPRLAAMRFKVAGHTDDRGTDAHNLDLSQRRADSVRQYLIEQGGIAPERLETEAHGEANPLMPEPSDYARRMNRRVEFRPIR